MKNIQRRKKKNTHFYRTKNILPFLRGTVSDGTVILIWPLCNSDFCFFKSLLNVKYFFVVGLFSLPVSSIFFF